MDRYPGIIYSDRHSGILYPDRHPEIIYSDIHPGIIYSDRHSGIIYSDRHPGIIYLDRHTGILYIAKTRIEFGFELISIIFHLMFELWENCKKTLVAHSQNSLKIRTCSKLTGNIYQSYYCPPEYIFKLCTFALCLSTL